MLAMACRRAPPRVDSVGVFISADRGIFRLRLGDGRVTTLRVQPRLDLPVAGDWDGDGWDELGGFLPSTGDLVLLGGTGDDAACTVFTARVPNLSRCRPVAGDFDGDGRAGIGLYDPIEGIFLLANVPGEPAVRTVRFGDAGRDQWPLAADFEGRGRVQLGVYDPARGEFLLQRGDPLAAPRRFRFGPGGGVPVAGRWRAGSRPGIGVYVSETGVFHLRDEAGAGPPDRTIRFFRKPARPVAGRWRSQSP